ncbi:MAG TPA: translation initiation factor IF-2, partial [Patescibacteria group bacterium]|nr:translation initiation factor IF-2 [Patescibacteria group bacterium]
ILSYDVIYRLLEEIEARLKRLLKPETVRTELGAIKVLAIFKTDKKEMIVGGKVTAGKVKPGTKAKVIRGGEMVDLGTLAELRAGKEIVSEAVTGESCGLKYLGSPVIKEGDVLEIYKEETKERKLKKRE